MFLNLRHKELDIYKQITCFIKEAYLLSLLLPADEKFNMVSQVRRAALSVKLNLAEGCSRKSVIERKRFFEISRGSLIEVDAAFETAVDLGYIKTTETGKLELLLNTCFAMLTKMIKQEN